MGYDGSGNYTRQRNFSADASAGIRILASAMDQEVDDIASSFNNVLLRDGQAAATGNIPMGGNRLVNVGAGTDVNEYMRTREFIENVPIYMLDNNVTAGTVSVSASFFTSVSATQAPRDGTKILVRVASDKASPVLRLSGHSANIHFAAGPRIDALSSGELHEFIFSSADAVWEIPPVRQYYKRTDSEIAAGVTPTNYQYAEGDLRRYGGVDDFGSGNTDNTAALTALAAVATASPLANEVLEPHGFTCYLRGTRGFCAASAVSFPAGCNVIMEVPLVYTGASNITFFIYGAADAWSYGNRLVLNVQNNDTTPTWASENFIGILLKNLAHCNVEIIAATLFTVGCKLMGHATGASSFGFTYNTVNLRQITGNKVGLILTTQSDGAGFGYCNENVFIGGEFAPFSTNDASIDRLGIRITSEDGKYITNNNNVFYKPSFEMGNSLGAGEALGIDVVHGRWNWFMQARDEGNDLVMRCQNDSMQNVVELGTNQSSTALLEQLDASNQNIVADGNDIPRRYLTQLVCQHQVGGMAEGVSGTAVRIPGVAFANQAGSAPTQVSGTFITYSHSAGSVTVTGGHGMGVFVETSSVKDFIVAVKGTAGGRVGVVCYDSGGTIIHDDDLIGVPTFFQESAFFGSNAYVTTADLLTPIYFRVSADVDRVFVMVMGGSAPAVVSGFSVWCPPGDAAPRSWTGFNDTNHAEDTAANIAAVGNAINTVGKYASKLVWDTTNTRMMRASGSAANSAWVSLDGATSVTPA